MRGRVLIREYRAPGEASAIARDLAKMRRLDLKPTVDTPRDGWMGIYLSPFRANIGRALVGLPHTLPVHSTDDECAPGLDGVCICGAVHGPPCEDCGGRAFHRKGCDRGTACNAGFNCRNCDGWVGCTVTPGVSERGRYLEVADVPELCPYCLAEIDYETAQEEAAEGWGR